MQDTALLDAVERYIRGEMLPEEKVFFEHIRATNPDVDQLVVEHSLFLDKFNQYGEIDNLKSQLKEVHQQLMQAGQIEETRPAMVVTLWNKYKRVIGVAASIAGITALGISGLISAISPKVSNEHVDLLYREIQKTDAKVNNLTNKLNSTVASTTFEHGGTGFLIDGKGYLVTNAHVVKNATQVEVQNNLG